MQKREGTEPYYQSESFKENYSQRAQPNYRQQGKIQQPQPPSNKPKSTEKIQPYSETFRERFYFKLFILGIIFFFVGYLLISSLGYTIPPERDDYEDSDGNLEDDDRKRYEDDVDLYNLIKRSMTTTGIILEKAGLILIVLALFIGAVVDEKLPSYARMGMFIALGLIIGLNL